MNQPNSPQQDDAVLGGQSPEWGKSGVLGGFLGVEQRFASENLEQRLSALSDAPQYGEEGLELLLQALRDPSTKVASAAYKLLQQPKLEQQLIQKEIVLVHEFYGSFRCLCTLTQCSCNAVAISSDSQILVLATRSGFEVWQLTTRTQRFRVVIPGGVNRIAITPDGQTLVSSSSGFIKLWNLTNGQEIGTLLEERQVAICPVAISPNGQKLVTARRVLNLETRKVLYADSDSNDYLQAVAISPNGKYWVGANRMSDSIRIVDLETGWILYRADTGIAFRVRAIAISPDGSKLIGSDWYGVRVWDFYIQQELFTIPEFRDTSSDGHLNHVSCFTLSPDNQVLFTGGLGHSIQLWELATGNPIGTLPLTSNRISALAISPDGQRLVSSDRTGTVILWGI